MNTNNENLEFCIIGCGRLGVSLAVFFAKQGYVPKAFSSKTLSSAQKARDYAGQGKVYEDPVEAAQSCSTVFITTPDGVIEQVCEMLAAKNAFNSNSYVYHLSGALSSSILVSAKSNGAYVGSIHPLQAFAPYEEGQESPFKGINMSIEGDASAVDMGKEIVNTLRANFFIIPTDAKTLYHASAVVASNYLVTLENFALELLKTSEMSEENAYDILEPLIMGTLRNIKARGSVEALTGPVARGDAEIVKRHLDDIDRKMPNFGKLYRLLGRYTLDIAGDKVKPEAAEELTALFKF